jgi:predicted nucleotidyltransferase
MALTALLSTGIMIFRINDLNISAEAFMYIDDDIMMVKDIILKTVPTEKIYLFGSHAYGTPNENSDYDIYVVLSNNSVRPVEAIGNIYMAMRGMKRKPMDILAGTSEAFERRSGQVTLEQTIAKYGVILYEYGQ